MVVSTSICEGFSNALAEGMACGLPAVATDVGEARLIIGDTGLIVPPQNSVAFADAITRLAEEVPDARALRSTRARVRIVDCFGIDRYAACYETVHRQLMSGQRGGHGE